MTAERSAGQLRSAGHDSAWRGLKLLLPQSQAGDQRIAQPMLSSGNCSTTTTDLTCRSPRCGRLV